MQRALIQALHLDAENTVRLSSSQQAYRETAAQLGSLRRLTSLRGLALVLRYDVSEAFDLLQSVGGTGGGGVSKDGAGGAFGGGVAGEALFVMWLHVVLRGSPHCV